MLGEPLRVDIALVDGEKTPAAECFRLKPGGGEGGAWIRDARFSVRPGKPSILEVRGTAPVREPLLRLGIELACGSEVSRVYDLLISPRQNPKAEERESAPAPSLLRLGEAPDGAMAQVVPSAPPRPAPRPKPPRPAAAEPTPAPAFTPAPALAPAPSPTSAVTVDRPGEAKMPSSEAAPTAAPVDDKGAPVAAEAAPATPVEPPPAPVEAPAAPAPVVVPPPPEDDSPDYLLYGGLAAALLLALGWLFYRHRQGGSGADHERSPLAVLSSLRPASKASEEDALFEGAGDRQAFVLVEDRPEPEPPIVDDVVESEPPPLLQEPELPVETETVPGVPEGDSANPALELADIMLSFGRVKGAAQALQEYIDRNPDEAIQPWIRLLDIYRMAGMREEFDAVARNLNQTFNVELQSWDEIHLGEPAPKDSNVIEFTLDDKPAEAGEPFVETRPQSLEDIPRVMEMITQAWPQDQAIEIMQRLLRDNRGGTRLGFSRPVVEDILFLIEVRQLITAD